MSIKRYNGQIDYFGFSAGTAFECTSSQATIATSDVAPLNADGTYTDFKADITGATIQCEHTVKCEASGGVAMPALLALLTIASADLPSAISAWKFVCTGWTLNTAAATLPQLTMTGAGVLGECVATAYDLGDNVVISPFACAQALFGIGSVTGGTLTGANYVCSGSQQTKPDGTNAPAVLDIAQGIITASLTIQQSADSTPPTFALGAGWKLQQPLTFTGTAGTVTTWTMTAVKPLARAS